MEVAKKFAFNDIEDMLSAVGFGGITAPRSARACSRSFARTKMTRSS